MFNQINLTLSTNRVLGVAIVVLAVAACVLIATLDISLLASILISSAICTLLAFYLIRDALLLHPHSIIEIRNTTKSQPVLILLLRNGTTLKVSVTHAVIWSSNCLVLNVRDENKRATILGKNERSIVVTRSNTSFRSNQETLVQNQAIRRLRVLIEHEFYRPALEVSNT